MSQEKILTQHGKRTLKNRAAAVALAAGIGVFGAGVYSSVVEHPKKAAIAKDLGEDLSEKAREGVQITPGEVEKLADAHETKENARAKGAALPAIGGLMALAAQGVRKDQDKDH